MVPADYVFGFAIALVVGLNLYLVPGIESARVAMQWSPSGEPTWYAPKWLAMRGMILHGGRPALHLVDFDICAAACARC